MRALAKEPSARFPNVQAFADALTHASTKKTSLDYAPFPAPSLKADLSGPTFYNMQASNPNNNTVQLWKPDSDKPVLIYHGHTGPVKTVSWSPNSKFVVSGSGYNSSRSNDALAQVWSAASGQTLLSYQGHNHQGYSSVTAVAWSPDGKLIASAGDDATVQVWRAIY